MPTPHGAPSDPTGQLPQQWLAVVAIFGVNGKQLLHVNMSESRIRSSSGTLRDLAASDALLRLHFLQARRFDSLRRAAREFAARLCSAAPELSTEDLPR